ncbi:calcium-binding protein [Pelagovum pacificum]|uniref:Calcium-binding protein n=1 Tax=Pelagovum pacificum TaxID=2588711 RepID=A0A5C5G8X9_9RHOB|nr:calcium-binding protein [Pelagovum pacificum]QQA45081.1 hypothetical protein I8N54_20030 [Pelagovum pacificum]TNY30545.1 hypothetical protein FHY64_19670 [Pelagovum pacificum]
MGYISVRGTLRLGADQLDIGISDLRLGTVSSSSAVVYGTTGRLGGLFTLRLPSNGMASLKDSVIFGSSAYTAAPDLGLIDIGRGPEVATGLDSAGRFVFTDTDASGALNGSRTKPGPSQLTGWVTQVDQANSGTVFAADTRGGILFFGHDGSGGLTGGSMVADTSASHLARVTATATARIGSNDYLFAADSVEKGVTSLRVGTGGATVKDAIGAADGIGIMTPTDIATATVLGETFVLLASSASGGGALSVFKASSSGSLSLADHVTDTLLTRFGQAQTLVTVQSGDRTFVVAGGGDLGLSLFVLLPGGRLVHLESIADTTSIGLGGVQAVTAAKVGSRIEILAASQNEAGLTQLAVSVAEQGVDRRAATSGSSLSGGNGDDLLAGRGGMDSLYGGSGDDILFDGAGADLMHGGAGDDIFIFAADGDTDRVYGFEPGRDRLDLSAFPFLYDTSAIAYGAMSWGARLTVGDEVIDLHSASGGALSRSEAIGAVELDGGHRTAAVPSDLPPVEQGDPPPDIPLPPPPADPGRTVEGTAGQDILEGGGQDDLLRAGAGSDSLYGGYGNDRLEGGDGDDRLLGGEGADWLDGGAGADNLFGGGGHDRLSGGPQDDLLIGGSGNDTLWGDTHQDRLSGGDGRDSLYGGSGHDQLFGEADSDFLFGGWGNDFLRGGSGDDDLAGNEGYDRIEGEHGNDRLYGDGGEDNMSGQSGHDLIAGGHGNDRLSGGDGYDLLYGGTGNDAMYGDAGKDNLNGHDGHDKMAGGSNDDRLSGGGGYDLLYGGSGNDVIYGDPGNDNLIAHEGGDRLYAGSGHDRLSGGGGDDTLIGGTGRDVLYGDPGNDRMDGGSDHDRMSGGSGRDLLFGGSGNDNMHGGSGNDHMLGGSGRDRISGGSGRDVLSGGSSADDFVFDRSSGHDRITDFNVWQDDLQFYGMSRSAVKVSATSAGLLVTWDDDSVLLQGLGGWAADKIDMDFG